MESDQHREPWNKGKLVGQATAEAKGHLGDPNSPTERPSGSRPGYVQPGN